MTVTFQRWTWIMDSFQEISFEEEVDRAMAWEQQVEQFDRIAGERRQDRRYDIHLEVRWRLIRRKRVLDTGAGYSVDLSSGGILIEADRPLPVGLNLELSLAWPVMLHNVAPMQLVISGKIIRTQGRRVAVQMIQHEFRTAGQPAEVRPVTALPSRTPFSLPGSRGLAGARV